MATTRKEYVAKCDEIFEAQPKYIKGKSDKTECDCIGMTKYGLRENGVSFSTTGTNDTYRTKVVDVRKVKSASDLEVGDVVFKVFRPGDPGYDLPDKYLPGGSGYNGDLNDYYHIGTVKSVSPLKIIHMTSPTAKCDTKIGKWELAASLKPQYISDNPWPEPTPTPDPDPDPDPVKEVMQVYAENGKPVNLRKAPSLKAKLVEKIKCGEVVSVDEIQGEWSHVTIGKLTGWMMSSFLRDPYEPMPDPQPEPAPLVPFAEVWSENGRPVKIRQKPSTNCNLYDELPVGTIVEVDEFAEPWSKISYGIRKGWYIMTKFLSVG